MKHSENARSLVAVNSKELSRSSSVLSSNVLNRFYSYLDVAPVSIRSYSSGIRQFMKYITAERISQLKR